MVRHREIEPEQAEDGADQPLGLAQGEAEDGPQGQRRRDRQGGVGGLPARRGARFRLPRRDRRLGEPDRQAAAPAQGGVVGGPVRDPVPLPGMRWRRAALALNGTAYSRGLGKGSLPYAIRLLDVT